MGLRRQGREHALQILYQIEIFNKSLDVGAREIESIIATFFGHIEAASSAESHTAILVNGVVTHKEEIDALLSAHSPNWKLERMSRIDRNMLRIAVYELLHETDLTPNIIIDEAIEIARKYGSEHSAAFVNGVLDNIKGAIQALT